MTRALLGAEARRVLHALVAAALAPILVLSAWAALLPLPKELKTGAPREDSVRYLDRDGFLLREVRADDTTRARYVSLAEMGENAPRAMVAAEDQCFYDHPGIDAAAVVRAAVSDALHARVVSGASTLTMQLARLVVPHRRDVWGKAFEMALALRIEASLSKRAILEQYLNRAPFGAGVRGIDAASRYYFDKPPRALSLAEAAALAAIPRGPAVYDMARHPERVKRRRDRILERMRSAGVISAAETASAESEPLSPQIARRGTFGAPHFVEALQAGAFDGANNGVRPARKLEPRGDVTTTIARDLQREAEEAARVTLEPLKGRHVTAASVVVLDNATGEILAYVGSPDWSDEARGGHNDGVRSARQPGSTLKPFVYALAMDRLGYTPATVLPDVELELPGEASVYAPMNYDERFHGPVLLREALGDSLNIPAVYTAEKLGAAGVLDELHAVGFASLDRGSDHYGSALALGDGEVTLLELTNAYATLARRGELRPVRATRAGGRDAAPARRVLPAAVADAITDILADPKARLAAFGPRSALELPFPVAAKTGTSKGYRDNWTVGYTREVTVGVWVGNFDGSPMEDVSGITGAGPLFRAVMSAAMRGRADTGAPLVGALAEDGWERVLVCPLSGEKPSAACPRAVAEWMPKGRRERLRECAMHELVRIDRRNGLRAGPGCGAADVEARPFEVFSGGYAAWAGEASRDMAPREESPLCVRAGGGGQDNAASFAGGSEASPRALHVAFPSDGAHFLLDPDRARDVQTLAIRVDAPRGATRVAVRVDGALLGWVDAPFEASWPLCPGDHVLTAEAPGWRPSAPVHIRVD